MDDGRRYFLRVQAVEPSINVVPMVAQGTVRMAVMGYRDGAPSPEELAAMRAHVAEAMEGGARGMCSGLRYVPSGYATVDELVELAKVVHEHGGVYATHMRSEGDNGEWLDAIDEGLAVGRGSGVRVQLSHLKALGSESWGRSAEAVTRIEEARAAGVDVAADQYPYAATSSTLFVLFPQWSQEGGIGAFLERIGDSERAGKIGAAFETTLAMRGGPSRMTVSEYAPEPSLQGKTLAEIAALKAKSELATAVELLRVSDAHVSMIYHTLEEDDIETIFRQPFVMVASDGSAVAPYGVLASDYYPHPRNYGCFPRVLGDFVRNRKLVDLGEAIRKMTSLPAERFNLDDRGQLRPGWRADITVFDPATVEDRATFAEPRAYPVGIQYVLLNGRLVLDRGEHTGARPGAVLYTDPAGAPDGEIRDGDGPGRTPGQGGCDRKARRGTGLRVFRSRRPAIPGREGRVRGPGGRCRRNDVDPVGPCVSDPYTRLPAMLAVAIASLDELSGGRSVLSLGAGGSGFTEMHLERAQPNRALRECIEIVRSLLAGDSVTFDGRLFKLTDAKLRFDVRPDIPIYLATRSPMNLELAGELADGAMIATYVAKPQLEFAIERIRAGAVKAGRSMDDVKLISWVYTSISDDGREAVENVRWFVTQALVNTSPEAYPAILEGFSPELPGFLERCRNPDVPAWRRRTPTGLISPITSSSGSRSPGRPRTASRRSGRLQPLGSMRSGWCFSAPRAEVEHEKVIVPFAEKVMPAFK